MCFGSPDELSNTMARSGSGFITTRGGGTSRMDRFRGGVFGYGLSENLLQGYEWLAKRYTQGDEIWIFGFSRGAYTARSLVGLIRKCGLLRIVSPSLLVRAERLYRDKALGPDSDECTAFKKSYSREPRVHFIGVWDTVGALGVPGTSFSEHVKFSWHDTELSSIVNHAYHAVALDEHRAAYDVPLWVTDNGEKKPANLEVEQRWFIGAHANVGGGYGAADLLADIPLAWMMEKAAKAGLKLEAFEAPEQAWETAPPGFVQGVFEVDLCLVSQDQGTWGWSALPHLRQGTRRKAGCQCLRGSECLDALEGQARLPAAHPHGCRESPALSGSA